MELETILKGSKLLCKNPLGIKPLQAKLHPIIEKVRLPFELKKAQKPSVKLKESSPELQLRLQHLQEFLSSFDEIKKIDNDNFSSEFQRFLEEKTALVSDQTLKDAYDTNQDPEHNEEDDFVHKARIEAAVLRKSPKYLSVISLDGCDEFLLEVGRRFEGLGIQVRIGDVISIVSPKSKQSVDPELVWCYKVYPHEAQEFLDKLKSVDDACKLLEDFVRSVAVWKYILNGFEEEDNQDQICKKILEVCQQVSDIASASLMTGTIRNFWTSFEGSKFYNDVLPKLVQDEAWRRENVQLVKKFLENLLKHRPECGVLALKIVEHILTIQDTGMEFMKNLLSILALNVSGVKDNPKHLKWNQRSVIPVASELHTTATPWKDLPHVKVADDKKKGSSTDYVYKSEEEYIKTYYTLMREECFHKLKKGVNHFLMTGKFDAKDIMMYRVHLVKAVPNINKSIQDSGLALLFEFPNKKSEESDDPDNSNWLMGGNLLCLSFDGTFKCPVWGIISAEPQKTKEKTQIQVSLCSERNKLSEADVITILQQLKDQGFPAYMVESNTYYPAFGPPLEVLQQKETVPLKEQLVQVQKCSDQPPEYLKNLKKRPDWSIVFKNPGCIELQDDVDYSYTLLVQEFKALKENKESKPKLDEKQLDAVEQALHNKVTLIQGPPGTGKSYVGGALLQLLLSMEVPKNNGPILVATYKNHALDNFLHTCAKKIPDFLESLVRVGRGNNDTPEELKERRVFEIIKNTVKDDYYDTLKRLKVELEAMKPGIEKCVKSLHSSRNKFTVSVFIKEAEEKHFKFLSKEHQYDERIKVILNDKHFQDKHFKELSKMIKEPLKEWLPSQGEFDRFAGRVTQDGFQSCIDVQQESSGNQDDSKDEPCNTRQFMPSEERQERQADFNEQDGDESADPETFHLLEETTLRVLPEIPDEKLGNVRAILNAGDIQQLEDYEKIQMVYALQQQRYKAVKQELLDLTQDFIQKQQRRKEVSDQREIKILQQHSVIGMTVSGAAIRAKWLESIKPSVLIVEEAAEILESQLVSVIPSSVQHLIMIGDHQQLRPQVHYEVLCRKCNFHISMFERLIRGGLEYAQLNKQGRMSDDIAELVRKLGIYDEYQTRKEVVESNKVPGCLSKSMFFYDHTKEEKVQRGSHSMYNEGEAEVVVQVAKYLVCENSVNPERITVLCSYRGQVQYLKKKLENQDAYQLSDIIVTTIDSFQGKENDIILLSLVRSSKLGPNAKIGYLSSMNRICVAVSRARTGLYLFGNTRLLRKKSSRGWEMIINHMAEKGLVGRNIEALIGIQGAAAVDGSSPGQAGAQPRKHSEEHLCNQGTTINIEANTVFIGDNNKSTNIFQDPGVADSHQDVGRPLQQSTPARPPQDDQPSQESQPVEERSKQNQESQPVKETSKYNISSPPAPGLQHNSLFEERRDVEEMSWIENQPSAVVTGTRPSLPSAEESEAQEMSWTEDSQSSVVSDSRPSLPSTEESEAQEMSWTDQDPHTPVVTDSRPSLLSADDSDQTQELSLTGDALPSATEADGRPSFPLEGSGVPGASDVESQPSTTEADRRLSQETGNGTRPVQDTYLPKQQQKQEEKEENDKVQPVEEMSEDKGQLVVGTQSDLPSMSDDVKASGEDVSSPQQDFPIYGSPADEKREQKIFDDEEACVLLKTLREAPNSADLIKELHPLQSLGAINNPDNQELTINDLKEKLGPEGQEILKKYLDDQGCNCDKCGGLR